MGAKKEMSIFDILNFISRASKRLTALNEIAKESQPDAAQMLVEANKHLSIAYYEIEAYLARLK